MQIITRKLRILARKLRVFLENCIFFQARVGYQRLGLLQRNVLADHVVERALPLETRKLRILLGIIVNYYTPGSYQSL